MVSEAYHDARLALLPAQPLKKDLSKVKRSSRPAPPSPPEVRTPPKLRDLSKDKENERIDKWDRMMRVSRRDDGGNVAAWALDERKGRKVGSSMLLCETPALIWLSCDRGCTKECQIAGGELRGGQSLRARSIAHPGSLLVRLQLNCSRDILFVLQLRHILSWPLNHFSIGSNRSAVYI
jgi:hypothetical protein